MKAIIFDLFQTLVDAWSHEKYTKTNIAIDLGVDVLAFVEKWEGIEDARTLGDFPNMYSVLTRILLNMNTTVSPHVVLAAAHRWEQNRAELFSFIDPSISAMLDGIRKTGCKIGLISNCWHDEMWTYQESKLHSLIDASILSCEIGLKKPDVQIYELCAHHLLVSTNECIYIGDGGSKELDGANRAGMLAYQAEWFIHGNEESYISITDYKKLDAPNDVLKLLLN